VQRRRRASAQEARQRADKRGEWLLTAAPLATALQQGPAMANGVSRRFGKQSRFSEPRLAGEEKNGRPASGQVPFQERQLAGATDEMRGDRPERTDGVRRADYPFTGAASARARRERRSLGSRQTERIGQQTDGVPMGHAAHPTLEIADAARAHASTLSDLLLGQAGSRPVASKHLPEGLEWPTLCI